MSGIVGVWNLDGRPLDGAVLDRMGRAISHRGRDGVGRWLDGPVGFACWHLWVTPEEVNERQPLAGPSGARLVMDGRLDNRDELLVTLGAARRDSDAALGLAAYERWGEGLPERLNGDFALGVFDPRAHRLLLARDAMGVRPLYYHHRPGHLLAFASEIKALLALPGFTAEPDLEGLADCLMLGQRPLDRQEVTCIAGVRALPAAHVLVATARGTSVRRYWDFDTGRVERRRSFEEYVEGFHHHFATAVRRRARSAYPVGVSVSGGLDSSSILCQMESDRRAGQSANPGAAAVSYIGASGSDADERRYLTNIEQLYGLPITRIEMEPLLGLVRGAEVQVRAVEMPFMDYMWGVTSASYRAFGAAGARVVLTGHWGDQFLFSSAYLVDLFRRLRWGQIWRHTREYGRWFGLEKPRVWRWRFLADLIRHYTPRAAVPPLKWIRRRLPGAARPRPWLSAGFRRLALKESLQPALIGEGFRTANARAVYLEARSKYPVQCMEWNNKCAAVFGIDIAFPFLDRDLVAFLMAVPGEMQAHDGVPRSLLREAMRGVLPEPVRARAWKADFSDPVNRGVLQDLMHIAEVMTGNSHAVRLGILDGTRLASEVKRLAAGLSGPDSSDAWDLADLFGLETWVRLFLMGGARPAGPGGPAGGSDVDVVSMHATFGGRR